MTPAPDDAVVIAESLTDAARFAIIFDRHFDPIHRFIERRLDRDVADSLAGEVFRIAFEGRARYDLARPNCLPWLYGIAGNLLLKERRRRGRHLRAMDRLGGQGRQPDDGADYRADERVDARALWPQVAAALQSLPTGERDVILLVAWEELTYPEVAHALGVPVGTVRSRLHRARERLRELIGAYGEKLDDDPRRAEGRCPS